MGPNFKYCYKEYFDFADHSVILSELGVAEHLYGRALPLKAYTPGSCLCHSGAACPSPIS
jgi:hypothetical protein